MENFVEETLGDRVVLVTGASSGIGLATARAFAKKGSSVVLVARSKGKIEDLQEELEREFKGKALAVPTDVSKENQVIEAVERAVSEFGRLDVVVNNAGVLEGQGIKDFPTEKYRKVMETNVDGVFYFTRETLPYLEEVSGNLIFLGSFAGQYPRPGNPVYAASKWWIRGFALSVEASVGKKGVAVTIINPSEVRTNIGGENRKSFKERYKPGEITEPEEVAETVTFAARKTSTLSEIDIYRRDKLSFF